MCFWKKKKKTEEPNSVQNTQNTSPAPGGFSGAVNSGSNMVQQPGGMTGGMPFAPGIINQRNAMCGGYAAETYQTKPVVLPDTPVEKFGFSYTDPGETPNTVSYSDGVFRYSTSIGYKYEPFEFKKELSEKEHRQLDAVLRDCGFEKMNGHCVIVNGLPPMGTCSCSGTYAGGVTYHFNFNGMRAPGGFHTAADKLIQFAKDFSEFSPKKCPKKKPVVHFLEGVNVFEMKEKDETTGEEKLIETVTFKLEHQYWRGENCEIITEGSLGNYHIRAHAEQICGGITRFDIRKLGYYEDTPEKIPEEQEGMVSLLKDFAGNVTMEVWRLFAGQKVNQKYPRTSYVARIPAPDEEYS